MFSSLKALWGVRAESESYDELAALTRRRDKQRVATETTIDRRRQHRVWAHVDDGSGKVPGITKAIIALIGFGMALANHDLAKLLPFLQALLGSL